MLLFTFFEFLSFKKTKNSSIYYKMQEGEFKELELREIILNTAVPLVIRQFPSKWTRLESLEKWCEAFDAGKHEETTLFESTKINSKNRNPQWERERKLISISATEFLKLQNQSSDDWFALNYQVPDDIPEECRKHIDFSCFGFPQVSENTRYWLGSRSANTPCHQDTYGVNIVVQMHGSKQWLLLPPDAPLTTTRIPYEESSIYCQENFYAPDQDQVESLKKLGSFVYKCILEAGDVLIVPRFWWHYVEALSTSLSVNAWIPLREDLVSQMDECIVKFLIETCLKNADDSVIEHVLNPNQINQIASNDELFTTLDYLCKKYKEREDTPSKKRACNQSYDYMYLDKEKFEGLMKKYQNIEKVDRIDYSDYERILKQNSQRLKQQHDAETSNHSSSLSFIQETLINSICSPRIIKEIRQEFQRRYCS